MPVSRNMAIFVLTTTTTRPITLPLAHARGVKVDKQGTRVNDQLSATINNRTLYLSD